MQTRQPEAFVREVLPCGFHSKNVQLCRCEKHRREDLTLDRFSEDFTVCELIFELFQILQTKILRRF